jgi:hypothetical protein
LTRAELEAELKENWRNETRVNSLIKNPIKSTG